jgi:hypothetical protein
MIYRADFTADNLKSRLISPVIFGNITKTYFDIMSEEEANKEIHRMIQSKTLISDMVDIKHFRNDFSSNKISERKKHRELMIKDFGEELLELDEKEYKKSINKIKNEDRLNNGGFNVDLRKKREEFRELKKKIKISSIEYGNCVTRTRNSIDRFTGTTLDKHLFQHEEVKYRKGRIFSIFVYTEKERVIKLIELALKIIEKVGIGTDTSIGNGVLKFIKHNGQIFVKDHSITLNQKKNNTSINFASTIITEKILENYKFHNYIVKRYDSKALEYIKPCYHYIECGSDVMINEEVVPYIVSNSEKKIKTYTCVFPVIFEGEDKNDPS